MCNNKAISILKFEHPFKMKQLYTKQGLNKMPEISHVTSAFFFNVPKTHLMKAHKLMGRYIVDTPL